MTTPYAKKQEAQVALLILGLGHKSKEKEKLKHAHSSSPLPHQTRKEEKNFQKSSSIIMILKKSSG